MYILLLLKSNINSSDGMQGIRRAVFNVMSLCLFGHLIAAALLAPLADAQTPRRSGSVYLKLGGGLSDLAGDDDASPTPDTNGLIGDFFDAKKFSDGGAFPHAVVVEGGYRVLPKLDIGIAYQFGHYPFASGRPLTVQGNQSAMDGDLGTARHTFQLLGRYIIRAEKWRVRPYLHGGLNVSVGGHSTGFGPVAGLGLNLALSARTSLFFETRFNLTFPDKATNGIEGGESFDVVSGLPLVGVKRSF